MNKKKRTYCGSFKIDTYLSRISSLSVFAWIDGEKYMGVYIGIQRKSKSKKVTQKGFEFELIQLVSIILVTKGFLSVVLL